MTTKLHVSESFSLPLKFLELRTVTYGGSGSGKTTGARVLAEEAVAAGVVVGVIDLKGDWWGLKSSADGKSPGIPFIIFGGEHQDLPIDDNGAGGAALADIVADLRQPFIVDLEQLSKTKQLRFLAAFFERLYDVNREPIVLFCDECDRYAPQMGNRGEKSPDAAICLGAVEDLAKRGRKHGIFPKFVTQRSASLNKNVSELCDVAIVYRTPGPRDQAAVMEWFATNATAEEMNVVKGQISGMPTGTAIVCSAHPHLRIFETVAMREPRTFDSSATPEIGKSVRAPKQMASADLDALREKMSATIERRKADDPVELRKRIAGLEAEAKKAQGKPSELQAGLIDQARADARAADERAADALRESEQLKAAVRELTRRLAGVFQIIPGALDHVKEKVLALADQEEVLAIGKVQAVKHSPRKADGPPPRTFLLNEQHTTHARKHKPPPSKPPQRTTAPSNGNGALSAAAQKFINILALFEVPKTRHQIATLAGYSAKSGTTAGALAELRRGEFISGKDTALEITAAGRARAVYEPLPTGEALLNFWLNHQSMDRAGAAFLKRIYAAHPNTVSRVDAAADLGYSSGSGSVAGALALLRKMELVTGPDTALKASGAFFQ